MPSQGDPRVNRPLPITLLATLYFLSAAAVAIFLATDSRHVVPTSLWVLFVLMALFQILVGRGLWKLRSWARTVTILLSAFFGLPCVLGIYEAFRSFSLIKLLLNLSFVTLQGMIIWYLLHPETRRIFEAPIESLDLN
jgi:uncharacterized membrane protein (DUF2068 family)